MFSDWLWGLANQQHSQRRLAGKCVAPAAPPKAARVDGVAGERDELHAAAAGICWGENMGMSHLVFFIRSNATIL